jgi:hypothetical protein
MAPEPSSRAVRIGTTVLGRDCCTGNQFRDEQVDTTSTRQVPKRKGEARTAVRLARCQSQVQSGATSKTITSPKGFTTTSRGEEDSPRPHQRCRATSAVVEHQRGEQKEYGLSDLGCIDEPSGPSRRRSAERCLQCQWNARRQRNTSPRSSATPSHRHASSPTRNGQPRSPAEEDRALRQVLEAVYAWRAEVLVGPPSPSRRQTGVTLLHRMGSIVTVVVS